MLVTQDAPHVAVTNPAVTIKVMQKQMSMVEVREETLWVRVGQAATLS